MAAMIRDVGLDVAVGADPAELPGLERAQDLDLGRRTHLADLVQEQGALVRHLQEPVLEPVGARERAALVPEQLALEEGVLERAAVDDGQGGRRSRAIGVEGPGDQLLPRAALALDQDRGQRACGLVDQGEDALDPRALADDLGEGVVSPECRLEVQGLAAPGGLLAGRAQDVVEVLEVEGLRDEVEGPVSGHVRSGGDGPAGGGDDDLRGGRHGPDRPQRVGSRHARQVQIEEDHGDVSSGELVDPFLSGRYRADSIPEGGKHPAEKGPDGGILVDDQDGRLIHCRKKTTEFLPGPLSGGNRVLSSPFTTVSPCGTGAVELTFASFCFCGPRGCEWPSTECSSGSCCCPGTRLAVS